MGGRSSSGLIRSPPETGHASIGSSQLRRCAEPPEGRWEGWCRSVALDRWHGFDLALEFSLSGVGSYSSELRLLILSATSRANSSADIPSARDPSRLRNATVPSATSRSPTTGM